GDERQTLREIARGGADPLDAGGFAALDDDDVALVDKRVGRRHRRIKAAARVVPQIEDKTDQLAAAALPQILHRSGERRLGAAVEAGDAEVADIPRVAVPR